MEQLSQDQANNATVGDQQQRVLAGRGDLDRAALSFEAGYALGCLVCGAALATVLDLDPSRLKPEPALAQDWNDLAAHAGVSSAARAGRRWPAWPAGRLI